MKAVGWSLRQRATRQFAFASTLFLAVVAALVMLSYRVMLDNELDEELLEQIEELEARYRAGPGGPAEFARLAAPTQEDAETPMAWRATAPDGSVWGPHGADDLVAALDQAPRAGGTLRIGGHMRVARAELAPELTVDLALDGRSWMERFDVFALICGVIVLTGAAASWFAGRAFATYIATQLEGVADELSNRGARLGTNAIEIAGAPNEIRAVAEAIESTLRGTEAATERAQLLLAGVAHDLRAPVQSMLTSTQVACLSPQLPELARVLLDAHQTELRRFARTIDHLVAWSSPQRVDGTDDATLEFDLVRNLVGNAIAWSPVGGDVVVSLRGAAEQIEIRVEDAGPGVPLAERKRIFEPFVRGATAPGRRAGYGLGLAIVRRTVDRRGGSVYVESSAMGGASFVIQLGKRLHLAT